MHTIYRMISRPQALFSMMVFHSIRQHSRRDSSFTKGQSMAYINGSWTKVEKQTDDIKITSSLANGSSFNTDSTTTTITLKNATKGSYSVDNGPVKAFTGSATVTSEQGKIADSDVTLKVTASNNKDSKTETFTFKKKFDAEKNGGYVDYEGETLAKASRYSKTGSWRQICNKP